MKKYGLSIACSVWLMAMPFAVSADSNSPYLEDLTWQEVRTRLQHGTSTIIIPTGGTEQNGPHIVIGKHNRIVRYTSGEIAKQLGNALAAPVIAYVPEGPLDKREGHMAFPGSISASEDHYAGILEDAARSFKLEGFKTICFIGDSGGNQAGQKNVAEKLSKEWQHDGVKVIHINEYYEDKGAVKWLEEQKLAQGDPTKHAGFMDTSEVMALDKDNVRVGLIKPYNEKDFAQTGAMGDPTGASAQHGKTLLNYKIKSAVDQIRAAEKN